MVAFGGAAIAAARVRGGPLGAGKMESGRMAVNRAISWRRNGFADAEPTKNHGFRPTAHNEQALVD